MMKLFGATTLYLIIKNNVINAIVITGIFLFISSCTSLSHTKEYGFGFITNISPVNNSAFVFVFLPTTTKQYNQGNNGKKVLHGLSFAQNYTLLNE